MGGCVEVRGGSASVVVSGRPLVDKFAVGCDSPQKGPVYAVSTVLLIKVTI